MASTKILNTGTRPFIFQVIDQGVSNKVLSKNIFDKLKTEGADITYDLAKFVGYDLFYKENLVQTSYNFFGMLNLGLIRLSDYNKGVALKIIQKKSISLIFNKGWKVVEELVRMSQQLDERLSRKHFVELFSMKPGRPWLGQLESVRVYDEYNKCLKVTKLYDFLKNIHSNHCDELRLAADVLEWKQLAMQKVIRTILLSFIMSNDPKFPLTHSDIDSIQRNIDNTEIVNWRIGRFGFQVPEDILPILQTECDSFFILLKELMLAFHKNDLDFLRDFFENKVVVESSLQEVSEVMFQMEKAQRTEITQEQMNDCLDMVNDNPELLLMISDALPSMNLTVDEMVKILNVIPKEGWRGKINWHAMEPENIAKILHHSIAYTLQVDLLVDIYEDVRNNNDTRWWQFIPICVVRDMFELVPESRIFLMKNASVKASKLSGNINHLVFMLDDKEWCRFWMSVGSTRIEELFRYILSNTNKLFGWNRRRSLRYLHGVVVQIVIGRLKEPGAIPKNRFFDPETRKALINLLTEEEFKEFQKKFPILK